VSIQPQPEEGFIVAEAGNEVVEFIYAASCSLRRLRLKLHVQDHLVPPWLTGLRLESLEPFAGLDKRRVLVPGLPGRTRVPGADDDPKLTTAVIRATTRRHLNRNYRLAVLPGYVNEAWLVDIVSDSASVCGASRDVDRGRHVKE
jgi:hypothetical protein